MNKQQIEKEAGSVAEYFEDQWRLHASDLFDKTFTLQNWTTVMSTIINFYEKQKTESKYYEEKLIKIFHGKKILHLGCGPGYFLSVVKDLGAIPFGIEPYCTFYDKLNIKKNFAEDLTNGKLNIKEKFDIIVAHDLFVNTIMHEHEALKIIESLKKYTKKGSIIILENQHEETYLKKENLNKYYDNIEVFGEINNPYNKKAKQIIITI